MKIYPYYTKSLFVILFVAVFVCFNFTVKGQTFTSPAGDLVVPHGPAAPLCTSPGAYVCKPVTVSGLPGSAILRNASIVLIDDESIGSLDVEVRSPTGSPTFMPFSRTGATSAADCGDNSDGEGTYTFQDGAAGNWWATAGILDAATSMPTGTYFPSFPGGGPAPPAGTANNTMSATFSGVTNGTWNVCVRDWGDPGGARFQLASLNFAIPTAASVTIGGRVITAGGSGIKNATVTLTGGTLTQPLTMKTGTFGYYSFEGIPSGGTYVVTVNAKRYTFVNSSQVLNVQDDIAGADFVAQEY